MAGVLTRNGWNEIVRAINGLAANPPEGCTALSPLAEVPAKSKWKKSDIRAAQNLLTQICNENVFSPVPALWEQYIVDELHTAIDHGWCGCGSEPEPCTHADELAARAEHGMQYAVLGYVTAVHSNCDGRPTPTPPTTVRALVAGLPIGMPGFGGREWRLRKRIDGTFSAGHVSSGVVACDGTVQVGSFNPSIPTWGGIYVFCGSCGTPTCLAALADADAVPHGAEVTYILELQASSAYCCP